MEQDKVDNCIGSRKWKLMPVYVKVYGHEFEHLFPRGTDTNTSIYNFTDSPTPRLMHLPVSSKPWTTDGWRVYYGGFWQDCIVWPVVILGMPRKIVAILGPTDIHGRIKPPRLSAPRFSRPKRKTSTWSRNIRNWVQRVLSRVSNTPLVTRPRERGDDTLRRKD